MEDAKTVYLAIKGDVVVHHTDLSAMKEMDGIEKPDMTITEEEFENAGCLARVINGEIFLGKTEEEIATETKNARVEEIDKELAKIDTLSARCSRAVSYAFATNTAADETDIAKVKEYEEKAAELRKERSSL